MSVSETKHPPHVRQEPLANPHTGATPPGTKEKERAMNEKNEVSWPPLAKKGLLIIVLTVTQHKTGV